MENCTLRGLRSQGASELRVGVSVKCPVLVEALGEFAKRGL